MPSVTTTQWAARFRDPCGTLYGGWNLEGSKTHLLQRYREERVPRVARVEGIWFACPGVALWLSPLFGADHEGCLAGLCSLIVSLLFDQPLSSCRLVPNNASSLRLA